MEKEMLRFDEIKYGLKILATLRNSITESCSQVHEIDQRIIVFRSQGQKQSL